MKHFQKIAITLLIACTAFFTACAGKKGLKDGMYTQSSGGHNGMITLQTTVKDGKIASVDVVQSDETPGIGSKAIDLMTNAVVNSGSVNIDSISGATITSSAVKRILRETVQAAGANDKYIAAMPAVKAQGVLEKTEYAYDVIVVGAGGAGLTAAITAKELGATVAVLEKTGFAGGNTLVSGGGLNVAGSDLQEKKGIADSPEKYAADTLKGGDNKNNAALVSIMAKNSAASYEWLRDNINVGFIQDRVQQFGGHSVPRACIPQGNSGYALTEPLLKKCEEMGIDIFYNTKAVKLLQNDSAVNGVSAENDGKTVTFQASKGVVLATGGFGANIAMREECNAEYGKKYKTTCVQASQGDGILMAKDVGAALTDMEYIQVYPTCNPLTGIISYVANSRFDGAVLVNKEGKRFTNEGGRRDVISQGILAQTDACAYLVWGNEIESIGKMTSLHAKEYDALEKNKLIVKADTLKDAAAAFGIDEQAFAAEIEKFNGFAEDKKDADFSKTGALRKIETGPFYIQKVSPATHHTMGGLVIDEKTRVQSKDGGAIAGLFAAGEVTGGIHGTNRLGGNAITDIITFGRIAGQSVCE